MCTCPSQYMCSCTGNSGEDIGDLLCHSPSYFHQTESPTEPGARLPIMEPQWAYDFLFSSQCWVIVAHAAKCRTGGFNQALTPVEQEHLPTEHFPSPSGYSWWSQE